MSVGYPRFFAKSFIRQIEFIIVNKQNLFSSQTFVSSFSSKNFRINPRDLNYRGFARKFIIEL